jgi:DNA polymerase-3 subunit alpha
VQYLQDVLETFAKKLIVLLNIKDLEAEFIHKLGHLFYDNKGDNQVSFEIMELEKVKKLVETVPEIDENEEAIFDEDQDDSDAPDEAPVKVAQVTEVEEIKVVTKVTMPSRKLKLRFQMSCFMSLRKCKLISN